MSGINETAMFVFIGFMSVAAGLGLIAAGIAFYIRKRQMRQHTQDLLNRHGNIQ